MYIVQFDKTYLDGNLKGMLLAGETVTYPERSGAERHVAFLSRVAREGDFIRAAVTGNRYQVSNVVLFIEPEQQA